MALQGHPASNRPIAGRNAPGAARRGRAVFVGLPFNDAATRSRSSLRPNIGSDPSAYDPSACLIPVLLAKYMRRSVDMDTYFFFVNAYQTVQQFDKRSCLCRTLPPRTSFSTSRA